MPYFRKRPDIIEARKFETNNDDKSNKDGLIKWIWSHGGAAYHNGVHLRISTLEGDMIANPGDWIIKGVNQEFYPCKAEIFEKTYIEMGDQ